MPAAIANQAVVIGASMDGLVGTDAIKLHFDRVVVLDLATPGVRASARACLTGCVTHASRRSPASRHGCNGCCTGSRCRIATNDRTLSANSGLSGKMRVRGNYRASWLDSFGRR